MSAPSRTEVQPRRSTHEHCNVVFDQMDAFDPRLAVGSFTAIIAFNVFHLLDDAPKVLARLNDLLAAGGLLISQTPCLAERGWVFRSLIKLAHKSGWAPPISSLTTGKLEALVNERFEILESTIWDAKNALQWVVARKT